MGSAMGQPLTMSLGERIILTLRKYGTVPVDFIARVNSRRVSEIEDYLQILQVDGIIKREGDRVSLSQP
jgi:hypothetical protein